MMKLILLADIRARVLDRLMHLHDNQCGVVDAETQNDLNCLAADMLAARRRANGFSFGVQPVC